MFFGNVRQLNKKNNLMHILVVLVYIIFLPTYILPQSNDDCLTCHSDNTLTMEKNGKEVSLFVDQKVFDHSAHGKLQCIACHTGFNIDDIPHKENIKPINCESCHTNAPIKHPFHPQMINANGVDGGKDVNCKGCHGTHDIISPNVPGSKFSSSNIVNACGSCHPDKKKEFETSAHANGLREGIKNAPNCFTCHKNQIVTLGSVKDSTQLKINQEKLCLSCHLDDPEIRSRTAPSAGFISSYTNSVHGKALRAGDGRAANCVNCHTAHEVKAPGDPTSTVNRFNIPNTCGQCHGKIEKEYKESIHGVDALQKGSSDAPVCINCHGEHNILKPSNPNAPTSAANVSKEVCSRCHASVTLATKYGLNPNRLSTFNNSYHGLALQGGVTTVANCGSCHGVHLVLPPSDPRSSVYPGNLEKTCGKCHPGANKNFAVGDIHASKKEKSEPLLYWISLLYIILIVSIIGAMLLHNILDFLKKAKIKKLKQMGYIVEEKHGHALYLRMNLNERIQHLLFTISFIILVITGFMLQFPNSWWVTHIRDTVSNAFDYRSILHRIFAVLMIGTSLYHIYYISFTERGKQLIKDLFPKRQDLVDAIGVAKFNLGLSKEKPKLDRFSYIEKAEYWALIWGTIIMSATGIIMWFNTYFIDVFTLLGWQVSRTIHYYEAWLATLAIIVWHFYFVIFNPDIYPMNMSWITGKMTEEEMAEEHPKELERIKEQQAGNEDNSSG
jgi:cytochrome b subunit of formate dehydrogenase